MDSRYGAYRDGKFVDVPPIDELCLTLKDKFMRQDEENERLRNENKKLKDGIFEKEEIARLKSDYEEMKADYLRGFPISKKEWEKVKEWQSKYSTKGVGAIGGIFTYKFTPTSIGVIGVCIAPNGDEFEFQSL